jgi:twitching motility two-component system response regulator PilH
MSEAMIIPPMTHGQTKRAPTVYFIDDSATMREVIKIAFRRENINVITCADAASALAQFDQNPPDAVITDVIMPDQDGYSVCTQIKQHAQFGHIPVVLMSGVVNKTVADRAVAVKADELIRKPFQPQELIGRVKSLLNPKSATPVPSGRPNLSPSLNAPNALSHLFAPPPTLAQSLAPNTLSPAVPPQPAGESAWPRALADAFTPKPLFPSPAHPDAGSPAHSSAPPAPSHHPGAHSSHVQPPTQSQPPATSDVLKLRAEIARLDLLVKKLQTELQIERQYNQDLEAQLQTLTRSA